MNRFRHALILLTMALAVMLIALSSTYTRTRHMMKDVSHVKPSAYKVVKEWP